MKRFKCSIAMMYFRKVPARGRSNTSESKRIYPVVKFIRYSSTFEKRRIDDSYASFDDSGSVCLHSQFTPSQFLSP